MDMEDIAPGSSLFKTRGYFVPTFGLRISNLDFRRQPLQYPQLLLRPWRRVMRGIVRLDLAGSLVIGGIRRHLHAHPGLELVHRCGLPFKGNFRMRANFVSFYPAGLIDRDRSRTDRFNRDMMVNGSGSWLRICNRLRRRQTEAENEHDGRDQSGDEAGIHILII